ncbi:MAG: hypothetical protein CMO08_05025 [Thalassospira sp.]|nr:hypothetical protein [Thalassospira sp.]|tara:strand:+ start:50927 stop:51136 length:210 start_codon:yes stop_codon:yes gene_type:complete
MKKHLLFTAICALPLGLAACGGGGAMEAHNLNATMGQELIDLKAAYDKDILTEREYNRAKKDIMKLYDR